ncbi:MAG: hypothetical protein IJ371_04440 [Clostridia bacterium]|nr:hypothetical protein [Clostridia bacterium]
MKFKNKILSFVLALCLIIPCALVFTACDKDKEPEAPTTVYVSAETSLETALSQVAVGGKIVLNADITLDKEVAITKKVTLDLNGKTINNTVDIWSEYEGSVKKDLEAQTWSLISVRAGGDLTITGNGTMEAKANDCYTFDVRGGKLTIENGTFVSNISAIYVYTGEAIINGGSYAIQQLAVGGVAPYSLTINCENTHYADDTANITINGGSFAGYDPTAYASEGNFLAEGLTVSSQVIASVTVYTVIPAVANN